MTEKRFTYMEQFNGFCDVYDNGKILSCMRLEYVENTLNRLNELNDENQMLKKTNKMTESTYHALQKKFHNWDISLSKCREENKELKKENEQLKKQLKCSREEADDYCEELMGKDEFVRLYKRQRDDALKENRELKADNNRLVNETAKVVAEHQRKVFKLIDEKIDELEGRYKFGQEVYKGCPMHNIRFGINVLKELKRELQE